MFLNGGRSCLILLACITLILAEKKVWLRNSFSPVWNPPGRLSCSKGNKITLPEDIFQLDPQILDYASEIVLPYAKGLIELKPGGVFECEKGAETPPRSISAQVSPPSKWIDPRNWRSPIYVPHLERLPCWYERVYLESPFKIVFPEEPIHAGSIVVDNAEVFTTSSSLRFFASHSNLFLFSNSPHNDSRLSGGSSCPDDSGCECGNEQFRSKACGGIQCDYDCSSGLKPKNHCCYNICGALIHFITYGDSNAKISTLDRIIRSSYFDKKEEGKGIRYHISKVSDSEYEIILVNTNGSITIAHSSAKRVEEALRRNFGDTSAYYIWSEFSGVGSATASSVRRALVGIFGGCVLGALLYTAVKALRRPESSLRQDLHSYRETMAKQLGQWRSSAGPTQQQESFSRFDNPDVELREPGGSEEEGGALGSAGFSFKELKSTSAAAECPPSAPEAEKSGIDNPGYVEVSLESDDDKIKDRLGIHNPTYVAEESTGEEDKIRDRLGIENPSYGSGDAGETQDNKIRDRLGLDNPMYSVQEEDVLEEEEEKIRDRVGIENPVYNASGADEGAAEGDEDRIRDRLGIHNPLYTEEKEDEIMEEDKEEGLEAIVEEEATSEGNANDDAACMEFDEEEEEQKDDEKENGS